MNFSPISDSGKEQRAFVDALTLQRLAWFIRYWFRQRSNEGFTLELFVINRFYRSARVLARVARACGVKLELQELDFDLIDDIRLPETKCVSEYLHMSALPELLRRIEGESLFASVIRDLARKKSHEMYISAYISKRIFFEVAEDLRSVFVAAWYGGTVLGDGNSQTILYLGKKWWFDLLLEYASRWNIELRPLPGEIVPWGALSDKVRGWLRRSYSWIVSFIRARKRPEKFLQHGSQPVRVAAEMYGNGVSLEPIYNSEFFWHRGSGLPAGSLFGYFSLAHDQPTADRRKLLRDAGIEWIDRRSLNRLMDERRERERPTGRRESGGTWSHKIGESLGQALQRYIEDFYMDYDRWHRFSMLTRTRIHVSTYDIFPHSEALHAALADTGGVSVSIQRSIEREPYLLRRTVTDVHFAFSRAQVDHERGSGSCIRQFITAGYPFDNAFPAARDYAVRLIRKLRSRGVEFTLCFLDENHGVHRKRVGGRRLIQEAYSFLCDKLTTDKTLGLIIKPKRPETLLDRLGPVWSRVQQFIKSGRCVFLDGMTLDKRYLPCVGASAADLSIGMLSGGTAGLESFLAGTRNLVIGDGAGLGALGRLPRGSVVFESWDELWQAVERFRAHPNDPFIGNWEPVIEEFASLRDGRASHRIGSYIGWLYEAFVEGKSREQALDYAGKQYKGEWGSDLLTEIVPAMVGQNDQEHLVSVAVGIPASAVS